MALGAAAAVCVAAGTTALATNGLVQSACMATNASGQRVVIGTELTDRGKEYKKNNPADDNDAMLEAIGRYGPELVYTRASIWRCRVLLMATEAGWMPAFALGLLLGGIALRTGSSKPRVIRKHKPRVFISYHHSDSATAERVHRLLEEHGLEVLRDVDTMAAGERIPDFIRRSLNDSDAVVSLVSSRSLLSAWVAMETVQSLQRNQWTKDKQFIACYLDECFLREEYRLEGTRLIDERLQRIEELLHQYASERLDTVDLNEEKTRLYDLRNNLGLILATLRNSLCLDLRDRSFDASGQRLVAAVRAGTARLQ